MLNEDLWAEGSGQPKSQALCAAAISGAVGAVRFLGIRRGVIPLIGQRAVEGLGFWVLGFRV